MAKQNLFRSDSLAGHFSQQLQQMERQINRITDLDELDDTRAKKLVASYQIDRVRLDRAQAEFTPTPTDGGQSVSVTIPFSGTSHLFSLGDYPGRQRLSVISGEVCSPAWLSEDVVPTLTIHKTFGVVSTDEVRAWAKETIDAIELELAGQDPAVTKFNKDVENLVARLFAARRAVLESTASLSNDLGKGI